MTLIDKNNQSVGNDGVNANNSTLENVNNQYVQNTYAQIIINNINSVFNDFFSLLPPNINLDDVKVSKKVTALQMKYMQNIDIDESIKQIYDKCYRICFKQLQDDKKYMIIKEVIEIIPKLTKDDLDLITDLVIREPYLDYRLIVEKYKKLVDLSLISIMFDMDTSNKVLTDAIKDINKVLEHSDRWDDDSFSSRLIFMDECIQYDISLSKSCKVIAVISSDIKQNNKTKLTIDLESKIWKILNDD